MKNWNKQIFLLFTAIALVFSFSSCSPDDSDKTYDSDDLYGPEYSESDLEYEYERGFNEGDEHGRENGYYDGYIIGHDDGYEEGYKEGYEEGYTAAIEEIELKE